MGIRGKEDRMSVVSSMAGDESSVCGDIQGWNGQGEKIFVTVRMRPLNDREIARNDVSDWECINNTTIIFKSNMPERSLYPTAYAFDRVFGSPCSTKEVYEEGAKEVALSVVSGINSSIFAYGQTSSGKTYTMSGITEYAVADIYEYLDKHKEREFVLKFSAMEIYNEVVRDLLSSDSTPLRLLDDPERGIVVEKLIEETVVDLSHLQDLLSICESQRQIGETSLNETSSRSHQILRLTVESSAREHLGVGNMSTLTATVNFVDLAGSERASQTLAAGTRLKEGSHINRSLLTLGTVIRKLSKGRYGHIPYRESKLTRILQNSLGGNAKTAIICTMSPAHSHVEQSRNTLLFASCAKEVTTNAQVNVVMSDKALVKQLQKELARLEGQMISVGSTSVTCDSAELLREKDILIEKLDKEIKELTWQRDLAQSRVESLLKFVGEDCLLRVDECSASESSEVINPPGVDVVHKGSEALKDMNKPSVLSSDKQILQIPDGQEDIFLLDNSTPKFSGLDPCHGWEEIAQRKNEESEDICKEVQCIEMEESSVDRKTEADSDAMLPSSEEKEKKLAMTGAMNESAVPSTQKEDNELSHINSDGAYDALKLKIQELQKTINYLEQSPSSSKAGASSFKILTWTRSSSRRSVLVTIPSVLWSEKDEENDNLPPTLSEKDFAERARSLEQKLPELGHDAEIRNMCSKDYPNPPNNDSAEEEVIKEIDVDVDDTTTVLDFVAGVNKMSKFQSKRQISNVPVSEASTRTEEPRTSALDAGTEHAYGGRQHHTNWPLKFERYRRKIIELWARCNVPLVHRSYFFLLFKGDPSDNVYMEVELRRLYFMRDTCYRGNNTVIDSQIISPESSLKALNREREIIAKQLQKKFMKKEREELYQTWGIKLETKQRSLQLARLLWTDTRDMRSIRDSAVLVAKLIGFIEPRYAPKELFGLSFSTPLTSQRSSSWRDNMSSLL